MSKSNGSISHEITVAGKKVIFETGIFAGQANASCTVRMGDTVVLATCVMSHQPREGVDFFPLMVDMEERLYAAGMIKGSRWIKREGRPSDEAIITGRLIDRTIRPLFVYSLKNEVQVVATVLSVDGENDSDIAGLLAVSAVLSISSIPWQGPVGGLRVGQIPSENDLSKLEWVINPSFVQREKCVMDMIVAGTHNKVLMIDAGMNEIKEETVYEGIEFCQKFIKECVDGIMEFTKMAGLQKQMPKTMSEGEEASASEQEVVAKTLEWAKNNIDSAIYNKSLTTKESRKDVIYNLKQSLIEYLEGLGMGKDRRKKAEPIFDEYIEKTVSEHILREEKRVDGRKLDEVRPLSARVGILPRTHGTGLFQRGQTQILSVVTLGAPGDEQMLEGIELNGKKRYMHHYNFPFYSVGETGPARSPGRREIGHGALAEKALLPVLPSKEDFPYTIRVVSEVLSSNGSSSMGSVCGSSLSLMDAGVPITRPVAGIAMGLSSDQDGNYKILTDLQDLEDGEGGMDFKVAGTVEGITAIQLDTKTNGLSMEICKKTLFQARDARMKILEVMAGAIEKPKADLSPYAPRVIKLQIDPSKIREVIGTGGKVINEIIDKTGAEIDIDQTGLIFITALTGESGTKAIEMIQNIVKDLQIGEIYEGKVTRIMDFGAIVEVLPGKDGMVHISELAPYRVNKVEDIVKLGDTVKVKVVRIEDGKVGLSIKALLPNANNANNDTRRDDRGSKFHKDRRNYR